MTHEPRCECCTLLAELRAKKRRRDHARRTRNAAPEPSRVSEVHLAMQKAWARLPSAFSGPLPEAGEP